MKSIIGVTANIRDDRILTTDQDNIHSIERAGGLPVVLPNLPDKSTVDQLVKSIDGLLATGGGDIDPSLFGEEPHRLLGEVCYVRDQFEMMIITECLKQNKPVLGICKGSQMLNIAAGGDMFQDIYSQSDKELIQHIQKAPRAYATHDIHVTEGSLLHQIVQTTRFKVNSFHHQAVRNMGTDLQVCATTSDGIIEAIESKNHRFALGVQWHPENLDDDYSDRIFKAFIEACKR